MTKEGRFSIFFGCFLLIVLLVICSVAVLKIDLTPEKASDEPPVVRTRNFGEGIRLSRPGLYGIDLVTVGKVHMRKLRKGPFSIGAINELVLEDVSLVLPEEDVGPDKGPKTKDEGVEDEKTDDRGSRSRKILAKLGIDAESLKFGSKMPRFSALAVKRLSVARLNGTNAVPWFSASKGVASLSGLKLYDGRSVENGVSNAWKEAFLVLEPRLALMPLK